MRGFCGRLSDRLNTTPEAARGGMTIVKLREMDERTTYMQQLQEDSGPVVLMNQFNVAPEDVERFLEAWADGRGLHEEPARLHLDAATSRHSWKHHVHERGRVGVREGARRGLPLARVPATRCALPRRCRRGATRLREGCRPRNLRSLSEEPSGAPRIAAPACAIGSVSEGTPSIRPLGLRH